jgi:predicted secreted protein
MRFAKYSVWFALLAMCISIGAFAKDKNEGKFTLSSPAQVGSTQLQPGDYKATWEGNGEDVQVKISQGKNVVATTSAKLVQNQQPAPYSAVTLSTPTNGTATVNGLSFDRRKESLVFSSAESAKN